MRINILCFGNYWAQDDGLGVHIYNYLREQVYDENVQIYNCGISPLNALPYFENCDWVILVDAIKDQGHIGKIHDYNELPNIAIGRHFSSHGFGVADLIEYSQLLTDKKLPQISLIGAEITPPNSLSNQLSPSLQSVVHQICSLILCKIQMDTKKTSP